VKNKLTDLNDILFAQLERLNDDDLKGEAVEGEVRRTAAMVQVADRVVENARLQLEAAKLIAEHKGAVRLPFAALNAGEAKA
jgi:hypothetical protein